MFSVHLFIFFDQVINEKIRVGFGAKAYNLVSFSMWFLKSKLLGDAVSVNTVNSPEEMSPLAGMKINSIFIWRIYL